MKLPTLTDGIGLKKGLGRENSDEYTAAKNENPEAVVTFAPHWNAPDVRGALYAMHGRTCAYCGCNLPRNDRGDVEHFRPKSKVDEDHSHGGYWWLAYSFENYLLGCRPCNSSRKGSRFPLREGGARCTHVTKEEIADEPRLLLNPCEDPIDDLVDVKWDDDLCPIVPRNGIDPVLRQQVEGTVKFFALNTDPELVRERIKVAATVAEALNAGADGLVKSAGIRYRCHSLVAFSIIREKRPDLTPEVCDELEWLLEDLLEDLFLKLKILDRADESEKKRLLRALDELLYSLAVLWKAPPGGDTATIEARLREKDVLDAVKPRYDKLG